MSHSSCSLRGRLGVGVPSPPGQSWPVHMGCQVCRCPSCHPPSQITPLSQSGPTPGPLRPAPSNPLAQLGLSCLTKPSATEIKDIGKVVEVTQAEGTGVWWERIREGSLTGSVRPQQPAQGAAQRHLALSDPVQEEPRRRRCQTGSKFGSDAR